MSPRKFAVALALILGAAEAAQAQYVYSVGGPYPAAPAYPVIARTYNATVYYANYAQPVFSAIPSVYPAVGVVAYPSPGVIYQAGYQTYASTAPASYYGYGPYGYGTQFGVGYGAWGWGRGWGYYGY